MDKFRYSALIGTRLDMILRAQQMETLLITVVSTNVCVETTARGGCLPDYRIVPVKDACAAYQRAALEMTLSNIADYFGLAATAGQVIRTLHDLSCRCICLPPGDRRKPI